MLLLCYDLVLDHVHRLGDQGCSCSGIQPVRAYASTFARMFAGSCVTEYVMVFVVAQALKKQLHNISEHFKQMRIARTKVDSKAVEITAAENELARSLKSNQLNLKKQQSELQALTETKIKPIQKEVQRKFTIHTKTTSLHSDIYIR